MPDVKLIYDPTLLEFDILIENGDLAADDGLYTAVVVSLFCDQRLPEDETAQPYIGDRRGWWGDETLPGDDKIGSLLWTLQREKITSDTIKKAKGFAEDALSWLITDGVAESVTATITREGVYGLNFNIVILQQKNIVHRYDLLWKSTGA